MNEYAYDEKGVRYKIVQTDRVAPDPTIYFKCANKECEYWNKDAVHNSGLDCDIGMAGCCHYYIAGEEVVGGGVAGELVLIAPGTYHFLLYKENTINHYAYGAGI